MKNKQRDNIITVLKSWKKWRIYVKGLTEVIDLHHELACKSTKIIKNSYFLAFMIVVSKISKHFRIEHKIWSFSSPEDERKSRRLSRQRDTPCVTLNFWQCLKECSCPLAQVWRARLPSCPRTLCTFLQDPSTIDFWAQGTVCLWICTQKIAITEHDSDLDP